MVGIISQPILVDIDCLQAGQTSSRQATMKSKIQQDCHLKLPAPEDMWTRKPLAHVTVYIYLQVVT